MKKLYKIKFYLDGKVNKIERVNDHRIAKIEREKYINSFSLEEQKRRYVDATISTVKIKEPK